MKKSTILKQACYAARPALLLAGVLVAANTLFAQTTLLQLGFNEGTGTTISSQVNGLVGTLGDPIDPANEPTIVADSPSGKSGDTAAKMNGTGFLVVDDSVNPILDIRTNQFTMEAWVKVDPADTYEWHGIMAYGGAYKLGLHNDELIFTLFGVVDIFSGMTLTYDEWHHVAIVWNPGVGVTFFLDGGNEVFVAETRGMRALQNNILGIGSEGLATPILATLDRARIHNEALTLDQLDSVADTPKAIRASTLVAYNFNETALPFKNAASTDRPAISYNTYQENLNKGMFSSDTPSGQAGDFSLKFGRGQHAIIPDPSTLVGFDQENSSFTLETWVKYQSADQPGTRSVLFWNNAPGGALSFSVTQNRHVFLTALGIVDQDSNAIIPDDGGWHHIAVVHEFGVAFRFYVDGSLADTVPYTQGVIFTRTDTNMQLGSEPGGGLQFVGSMDRFRVTKGVLTPDQMDWWPVPGVQPGAPSLTIESTVKISWPTVPSGYNLQQSTDLNEPRVWTAVTNTPLTGEGSFFVVLPTTGQKTFYRLYKP